MTRVPTCSLLETSKRIQAVFMNHVESESDSFERCLQVHSTYNLQQPNIDRQLPIQYPTSTLHIMTDKASWAEPLIDDVESQNKYDDSAKQNHGIVALNVIESGFVCGFFRPWGDWVSFATILIGVLCMAPVACTKDPALNPKLKKWGMAAFYCLAEQLCLAVITFIIFPRVIPGNGLIRIFWILIQSLYLPSGICLIVYTCGRKWQCLK